MDIDTLVNETMSEDDPRRTDKHLQTIEHWYWCDKCRYENIGGGWLDVPSNTEEMD